MIKHLQVGSKKLVVEKPHLKKWVLLEQVKAKETDRAKRVYLYLSVFLDLPESEFATLPWQETISLYVDCLTLGKPSITFPWLSHTTQKQTIVAWDYPERLWYAFSHMLAKTYNWSLEYIAELDLEYGLALLQEILTDRQLDLEWQWSLSELAYPYDAHTKTNKFRALPRPAWMEGAADLTIKKVRIPKSMMPVGNVIGLVREPTFAPD